MKQNKTFEDVLLLDCDWLPKRWWAEWVETRKAMLEKSGLKLIKVIKHPSSSKRGLHVWLHVESEQPLTDWDKVKLQFFLGDCPIRSMINHRRVWRGIRGFWNKLFNVKHTIKKRPKRCQRCKIIKVLEELADKDGEYWFKETEVK